MMCTYSPRGTFRLRPVTSAAANKMAVPMPAPARRRLQGVTSRKAIAAAIQLRPQARASSTTSSRAPTTLFSFRLCGIVSTAPGWHWIRSPLKRPTARAASYSARAPEARVLLGCGFGGAASRYACFGDRARRRDVAPPPTLC